MHVSLINQSILTQLLHITQRLYATYEAEPLREGSVLGLLLAEADLDLEGLVGRPDHA